MLGIEYLESCHLGSLNTFELFVVFSSLKRHTLFAIKCITVLLYLKNCVLPVSNKALNLYHGIVRYVVNCKETLQDVAYAPPYKTQQSNVNSTQLSLYHSGKIEKLDIYKSIDIVSNVKIRSWDILMCRSFKISRQPLERKNVEYFAVIAPITTFHILLFYGIYNVKQKRHICAAHHSTKLVVDINLAEEKQGNELLYCDTKSSEFDRVCLCDEHDDVEVRQTVCFLQEWEISSTKNLAPPVQLPPNIQGDTRREAFRLSTFQSFPSPFVDVSLLANAGFYFTGRDDFVQCFSCLNVVSSQAVANPFESKMHMENCAFQELKNGCGNVPIDKACPSLDSGYGSYSSDGFNSTPAGEVLLNNAAPSLHSLTYRFGQPSNAPITPPIPPPSYENIQQLAAIYDISHKKLIQGLTLSRESDRYITFRNWGTNSLKPHPRALAKAGFFYLGNLDRTQCFSCSGVLRDWGANDNPGAQHLRHFAHCDMAQGRSRTNVPDLSFQPQGQGAVLSTQLTEEEQQCYREMFPCERPANPRMRLMRDRIQTFNNWTFTRITPNVIAAAGFFSLGVRDKTKCFYCNGGLQNWRFYDDPWKEHAKWYPTCDYLLRCKGPDFVHSVTALFPNLVRPVLRAPGQDVPPPQHRLPNGHSTPPASAAAVAFPSSKSSENDEIQLLKASLETDVAKTVIGMGYDLSMVKEVNRRRIVEQGQAYGKAVELLEAVTAYENESSMETNEVTEPKNDESLKSVSNQFNLSLESSSHETPDLLSSLSNNTRDVPTIATEAYALVPTHSRNGHSSVVHSNMNSASNSSQWNGDSDMENESQGTEDTPVSSTKSSSSSLQSHVTPAITEVKGIDNQHSLESKFEDLLEEQLCKVCLDRNKEVLFFPCNHLCCCMECSVALRNCPMCRTKIEKGMRIYTSN